MILWKRRSVLVSLFALLALGNALSASDLAEVKRRGVLVMLSFPHDASKFITIRDGEYWGLDHEILRTFAVAHGLELQVQVVPSFSELIPWLLQEKGDLIGSSFSITEERQRLVDFSESYFPVRIMVVGRTGAPVPDVATLESSRLSVVPGSSLEAFVKRKMPSAAIVPVSETPDAFRRILEGKADFAPVDSTSAMTALLDFPGLETVFTFPDRTGYGFAVARGSDIGPALSMHIQKLRSSGLLYQQLERYLGPEVVKIVKAAEVER
jgi:ABC-type amino acid transport substrate-binding protein